MNPQFSAGYLAGDGRVVFRPRPRQCKFCGAQGESYGPIYICPAEECQAKKHAAHRAAKRRYDVSRRAK